jgi:hypothetical protein
MIAANSEVQGLGDVVELVEEERATELLRVDVKGTTFHI